MNDLTILHLSDLHFEWSGGGNQYPKLHRNMIVDIENQIDSLSYPIVIVITGDLVNKGKYDSKVKSAIRAFFTDLKKILGNKVLDIFFVCGNHDKKREVFQEQLFSLFKNEPSPMTNTYEKLLNEAKSAFTEYKHIITEIYELFGVKKKHIATIANTYGVDIVNTKPSQSLKKKSKDPSIKNASERNFCFISLNTVLNSAGDNDYRNLRLGNIQLEEISKGINSKEYQNFDAVIVLAHHPVNWLTGYEENLIQDRLLSPAQWSANLYLCGHVHERDAISWHNAHHSLTTLMTGFGWPDAGTAHSDIHLYSIYVLNIDLNSMDIYVRATSDGGTFIPDFRFYGQSFSPEQGKIVYPIDSQKAQSYIELNSASGRSNKAMYVSKAFSEKQQKFSLYLCVLQSRMTAYRYFNINEIVALDSPNKPDAKVLQKFLTTARAAYLKEEDEKDFKACLDYLQSNMDCIYEKFDGFLQYLCLKIVQILAAIFFNDKDLQNNIRCHIRYLNVKDLDKNADTIEYCHLCYSFGNDELDFTRAPKPIKWNGSLIKESFLAKAPLIYEGNRQYGVEPDAHWSDFITFIPDFPSNQTVSSHISKNRPYLSMGISCHLPRHRDYLRLFNFVRIDAIVGEMINSYLETFCINIEEFIRYIIPKPSNESTKNNV